MRGSFPVNHRFEVLKGDTGLAIEDRRSLLEEVLGPSDKRSEGRRGGFDDELLKDTWVGREVKGDV
jgi:hypothetical protein